MVPVFEDIKKVKIVFSVQEEFAVRYELRTEKLSPILVLPSTYIEGLSYLISLWLNFPLHRI